MSKLTEKVAPRYGRLARHWRGDRETPGRRWSERGHHILEGRRPARLPPWSRR